MTIPAAILALAVLLPQDEAPRPDRAAALEALRALHAACAAGDFEKAGAMLKAPPGTPEEAVRMAASRLIELREISAKGIDVLEARGTFGPAAEVFKDRAKRWAERAGVRPEDCWAYGLDGAEAAFWWDGRAFRILRCDDVGKLEDR